MGDRRAYVSGRVWLRARRASAAGSGHHGGQAVRSDSILATRLRAHPVSVTVASPTGQRETVTITLPSFLSSVEDYLASTDTAVLLPAGLHALARGQWAEVLQQEESEVGSSSGAAQQDQLQQLTIRCGDAWAAMNAAQMNQQNGNSVFVPYMAGEAAWQQQLCALWPHDPGVSGVVRSTAPIVFLNGTADPADPPANVAAAPLTMPNALLVSVPDGAHGVVTTGCVLAQTTAFIQAGTPADRSTWAACTRALQHELPAFRPAP